MGESFRLVDILHAWCMCMVYVKWALQMILDAMHTRIMGAGGGRALSLFLNVLVRSTVKYFHFKRMSSSIFFLLWWKKDRVMIDSVSWFSNPLEAFWGGDKGLYFIQRLY